MEYWYRRQYNLPPNDPRFLDVTMDEIAREYWAAHYFDKWQKGETEEEFEDPDFDESEVASMDQDDAGDDGEWVEVAADGASDV